LTIGRNVESEGGRKNMKLGTSTKVHFVYLVVPLSIRRIVSTIQNHPAKRKKIL